jgi:hypothetical protein
MKARETRCDACLVGRSELETSAENFTLDSDFRIYCRHGNKVVPVLMPDLSPGYSGAGR